MTTNVVCLTTTITTTTTAAAATTTTKTQLAVYIAKTDSNTRTVFTRNDNKCCA